MFIVLSIELIMAFLFLVFYFVLDALTKRKKLKINQFLWDEYSKNMTYDEKMDCFTDWLENNKAKHGDEFYYIPKM